MYFILLLHAREASPATTAAFRVHGGSSDGRDGSPDEVVENAVRGMKVSFIQYTDFKF